MPRLPLLFVPLLLTALFGAACSRTTPQIKTAGGTDDTGAAADMAVPGVPPRRAAAFASLPDRGNLIGYPAQRVKRQEHASTWHRADVSEEHALRAVVTGEMTVAAPDGQPIRLRYQRHLEHPNGNWTWVGRNEHGEEAIVTFGEKAVFGSIPRHGGEELRLATSGGRSWVVEADPGKQHHPDPKRPDYVVPPELAQSFASSEPVTASASMEALAPAAVGTTVDVALGYTTGFASELGGDSQAVTRLQHLVDIANQAYANSQINAQIRLVRTVPVNYADATDNNDALAKLSGYQSGSGSIPVDPAFNALRTARDQYGADLVSLVRRFRTPENEGCGVAWLIGENQSSIDSSDARWGYSVVSDDLDRGDLDESDNKTYVCRKETLAHELGHNMGQAHNIEDSDNTSGLHSYSYGYRESSITGFYTVMAYRLANSSQRSIRYFSNPNVGDPVTGRPTGNANVSDNARSMAQTMPLVAAFRGTIVAGVAPVRRDFDGDGRSDVYWRNAATGENGLWRMSEVAVLGAWNVYREPDQTWVVVGSGDFNGDRRSDVLWRSSNTGHVYVQFMNGPTILPESRFAPIVDDLNWRIVGLADFDGDAITDIYWRNIATGLTYVWAMNGAEPKSMQPAHLEPDQSWKVAGTGDFNGDGFADVLWRHSTSGQNYVHMMSGAAILPSSGSLPTVVEAEWKVAAVDDFNGDGRADIYWRNSATGECYLWLMSSLSVTTVQRVHSASLSWEISASGDFNGDGRADIFWRNRATGENYMHLMSGTSILPGSGVVLTVADTNWKIPGL
jgi:peptidyl-Asp metalloendopeptidase